MTPEIENDLDVFEQKLYHLLKSQRCFLAALMWDETTIHGKHFDHCVNEILDLNKLIAETLQIKVDDLEEIEKECKTVVAETIELERMMELNLINEDDAPKGCERNVKGPFPHNSYIEID